MRNLKQMVVLPIIGILALTGCQTTKTNSYTYHELDSILEDMVKDAELRQTLVPQLEKAIKRNSKPNFNILQTLADNFDARGTKKQAFPYYQQIALHEKARPRNYVDLACRYWFGTGTPKNKELAIEWLQKAARLGEEKARLFLSEIYRNGLHGYKDLEEAQYWEVRALSSFQLSRHPEPNIAAHSIEMEIANDLKYSECESFFEPLIKKYQTIAFKDNISNPQTIMELINHKKNIENAKTKDFLPLLLQATEAGHPEAHEDLGYYYKKKNKPQYDPDKAIYHFKTAASLSPYRFYPGDDLGCLLWEKENKRAEAVFWFAYDADSFPHEEDINRFNRHLNKLTPNERRDFDLMYENWAYNGKLP